MTTADRVLVIGAGFFGLAVAKALKSHGIAYDQVDAADCVGGNWYNGVYDSVHIVSSRKTTQFPDFRMPRDYPDFPNRQQMLDYLDAYVERFGLLDHVELNKTVTQVTPSDTGGWNVHINGEDHEYHAVVVCNGHHWDRRWPGYEGKRTGQYIHSKDYKGPDQLRGKHVLVIGGGNSACDIISEAARVGASARLSLRRGYWFIPKVLFGRAVPELFRHYSPLWMQRLYLRAALKVAVGSYRRYGLPQPDHKIFEHHPTLTTELFHYLKHGRIRVRPDVLRFDGDFVEFTDGTRTEFDIVVAATGFHLSFPFLAPGLVTVRGQVAEVYADMVTDHRNLYIFGWAQSRYGFGPHITPAAELLAELIKTQDQMRNPIGRVLRRLGQRTPRTHLADPFKTIIKTKLMRRLLPVVRLADRWIKPSAA
jgi:cation diffusion facilitator CzcD-associated flavoprotein CzcO